MKLLEHTLKVLPIAGMLLLSGCVSESPWGSESSKDGRIELNLVANGNVSVGTRDDKVASIVPDPSDFSINLKSTDGSYEQNWNSKSSFDGEEGFPVGDYIITAFYGDMDKEGFNNPYYVGKAPVSISKGGVQEVYILASLANAMISVRYTDDFKDYFKNGDYSASVETTGHTPVKYSKDETKPAYFSLGKATVRLNLKNEAGKEITVTPTEIKDMVAKIHYIVTFDIDKKPNGDATLTVEWSEESLNDPEDTSITLNDDAFDPGKDPIINVQGYTKGGKDEVFEGIEEDGLNPEFHIVAGRGLKEAILTMKATDNGVLPAFGEEVELIGADSSTQDQVKESGLECFGIFKDVDKLAVINLKQFVKNLKPGTYTVGLKVTDKNKISKELEESVKLNVMVEGIKYEFVTYDKPDYYFDNQITVYIATNWEPLKDKLKFRIKDSTDKYMDVVSGTPQSEDKGSFDTKLPYVYSFALGTGRIEESGYALQCEYNSDIFVNGRDIEVNMPDISVETDAFAKKVKFRITSNTLDKWNMEFIKEHMKLYCGDIEVGIQKNPDSNGIYTMTTDFSNQPLKPGEEYENYTLSLDKKHSIYVNNFGPNGSFTTEVANDEINGNFENTAILKTEDKIKVGGSYRNTYVNTKQIWSTIYREVPTQWCTLNDKTCYLKSDNLNTWYIVPSVFIDGIWNLDNQESKKVVLLRSVAYSHNGKDLGPTGGAANTTYYCTDFPDLESLERAKGELFLGTYIYNGKETRTDGIEFSSRPTSLSFDYSYSPLNNEVGELTIAIIGKSGKRYENKMDLVSTSPKSQTLSFPSYDFLDSASKIEINFKSSKSEIPEVKKPDSLDEGVGYTADDKTKNANDYITFYSGSELRISNIHLVYE